MPLTCADSRERMSSREGDQTLQHDPAIDAEHIADDAADPDPGPIDGLLRPAAHPSPLLHQTTAMAVQRAQGVKLPIRHHARPPQPELAHPSQPAAVLDICLAPAQLLHMLRMQQLHLDPRVPHPVPRRPPIDPRAFHRRRRNVMRRQPGNQRLQPVRQCAECPRLADRTPGTVAHTYGRRDLHLVNVQSRRPRVDNMQCILHHGSISSGETRGGDGGEDRGSTRSGVHSVPAVVLPYGRLPRVLAMPDHPEQFACPDTDQSFSIPSPPPQ